MNLTNIVEEETKTIKYLNKNSGSEYFIIDTERINVPTATQKNNQKGIDLLPGEYFTRNKMKSTKLIVRDRTVRFWLLKLFKIFQLQKIL